MNLTRIIVVLLATAFLARADVLPPAQDTYSLKGKLTPTAGKATTLPVNSKSTAFVFFNLGNLPDSVQPGDIASARLRIYFPSVIKAGEIDVHTVTPGGALWTENTTETAPAVDAGKIAMFPAETVVKKKFVEVDVTPTVQAWRAGTPQNYGFAFVAVGAANVAIGAKEGSGSGYPCELDLEIGVPAGSMSIGTAQIADGAVGSAQIANGAVGSVQLANGAVGSEQIASGINLAGTIGFTGGINLAATDGSGSVGVITQGGQSLLQTFGSENFFAGVGAGNFTMTGDSNTAVGTGALSSITTGFANAAVGVAALAINGTGYRNVAVGLAALEANTTGVENVGIGESALRASVAGNHNTGLGKGSMQFFTAGDDNTAVGYQAGWLLDSGNGNIFVGTNAGISIGTGDNNIDIGNNGVANESNIIRIGFSQTDTFLTGVIHGDGSGLTNLAGGGGTSLNLPVTAADGTTGVILQNSQPLIHTFGSQNFFAGAGAGNFTMSGNINVAVGTSALSNNTSGTENTAYGAFALNANTDGVFNSAGGAYALNANTDGATNAAFGVFALGANTTGNGNTAFGAVSLMTNTTGSNNIALGNGAGTSLTTGDNNIDIGNSGQPDEAGIIRIGTPGVQAAIFLAAVRGSTTGNADAIPVLVDSAGQLGVASSSRRYKEDIADMGDVSARLEMLRPVTFHFKKPYANGEKPVQFGLIAEEVAEVFPELAVRNAEGQPETVKYQDITPLLLNEFLKERHRAKDEETKLREENAELKKQGEAIKAESEALKQRLERLEARLGE